MEAAPRPHARRASLCAAWLGALGVLVGLCFVSERFEAVFRDLEMKSLPAPTETFLALAGFTRSPLGLAFWGAAALAGAAALLRGAGDARPRLFLVGLVVATCLLISFVTLGLFLPILKIQQALAR